MFIIKIIKFFIKIIKIENTLNGKSLKILMLGQFFSPQERTGKRREEKKETSKNYSQPYLT